MRQPSKNHNSNNTNISSLNKNLEKKIIFEVSLKDATGLLKLDIRKLNLEFNYIDNNNVQKEIKIECLKRENNTITKNIKIIKKYNLPENVDYKYLLYIKLIKDDEYVFRFKDEKDRDFLLNRLNFLKNDYHFYIYEYQHLTNLDKKKIKLILENPFLSNIFNELVYLNDIFDDIDYFLKFIKKKYPNYIKHSIIENNIQISRDDEVNFKKRNNQILNKDKINKLISSNTNLKILYNKFKKTDEKNEIVDFQKINNNNNKNNNVFKAYLKNLSEEEKNFWEKFLKNNWTQDTEIFGGLNEIYLTVNEKEIINQEIKNYKKNNNIYKNNENNKNKEPTLNEKIELNNNFIIPFENNYRENFKDKLFKNEYEIDEYERTNCNLFINNLNDYCMRKIKNSEFIPEINNLNINNNNKRHKTKNKNLNINKKKINNKIEKNKNILDILNQMKMEKKENNNYKKTYENINKKYINNLKKLKSVDMYDTKNYIIRFCQIYKDIKSLKIWYDIKSINKKNLEKKSELCDKILTKYSNCLEDYFNNLNIDINNKNYIPYLSLLILIENTIPNSNLNKKFKFK